jgi:hypothetical protein
MAPVEVIYLRVAPDQVDVISHHPYAEQRRHQIWVRYADRDPLYKDHEYVVDRDGVEPIGG